MQEIEYNYPNKLKSVLYRKQDSNPSYSLRAFARDLGIHPSTLSLVLSGKRPLPKKSVERVVEYLELTPIEESLFRESLGSPKSHLDKIEIKKKYFDRYVLDEAHYSVLAEWEHYVVVSLLETSNFEPTKNFIAKRIGISLERTSEVLANLERAGLITQNDHGINLTQGPLRTSEDISSKALKDSHKENLDLGKRKLEEVPVELRDFSSLTLAVNTEKLPEAKIIIREFRKKMASLMQEGEKKEVFQLAIQFYPMTNMTETNIPGDEHEEKTLH